MAYQREYNAKFGELGFKVSQRWPEKDIIKAKSRRQNTLGLALSGGGYRSAIFNYGVLAGLHRIGVLEKADYLSVVSGGSWIGTAAAMTESFDWFFHRPKADDHPNFIEEGFESLLPHPGRVLQEAALARANANFASNIYGRLLARTFLRERGGLARTSPLSAAGLIRDDDRPFLIVNGTVYYRAPNRFDVSQECFEMTRLYCGSRSFGYVDTGGLKATERPLRVRDAIAISGAAVALHVPGLSSEVVGLGLSREIENYTKTRRGAPRDVADAEHLDVADGGFYNNLGIESLINRGCRYIIVVDAEHDPERKTRTRSNQSYHGLRTLLRRHHIPNPIRETTIRTLDRANEAVHHVPGGPGRPEILYIKLKSLKEFDNQARRKPYNQPGFLRNLFGQGTFAFDPQFSTAKLDYNFAEHRNLSEIGAFMVHKKSQLIRRFADKAK